jgi:integrase
MAYAYKRGSKYQGYYKDGGKQVYVVTAKRKEDALRAAEEAERSARLGERLDPQKPKTPFDEFAADYLRTQRAGAVGTKEKREVYARRHLTPFFGTTPLGKIDATMARRFVAHLDDKGLGAWSVRGIYGLFQTMMGAAVEEGFIPRSPCTSSVRKALPTLTNASRRAKRWLTAEEIERLADAIDERYRAAVLVMGYMGLRRGEIAGLQRSDIDLKKKTLSVNHSLAEVNGYLELKEPKSASSRRKLEIPDFLVSDLRNHKLAFAAKDYVFASPEGGPIRPGQWVDRFFTPTVKAAGLEPLTPHQLRHSAVALLIKQGAHPKEIQAWCGHSNFQMTMDVYGHLFPEQNLQLVKKLDEDVRRIRRAGAGVAER